MATEQALPTKLTLSDEERKAIRWSSTKRGHVVLLQFAPRWTRRGMFPVRPVRSKVFPTATQAWRKRVTMEGRYMPRPVATCVLVVDHLGNVVETQSTKER